MENGIRHMGVKIYPQGVLKQRAISVVKSKTSKQADFLEHKGHAGLICLEHDLSTEIPEKWPVKTFIPTAPT